MNRSSPHPQFFHKKMRPHIRYLKDPRLESSASTGSTEQISAEQIWSLTTGKALSVKHARLKSFSSKILTKILVEELKKFQYTKTDALEGEWQSEDRETALADGEAATSLACGENPEKEWAVPPTLPPRRKAEVLWHQVLQGAGRSWETVCKRLLGSLGLNPEVSSPIQATRLFLFLPFLGRLLV